MLTTLVLLFSVILPHFQLPIPSPQLSLCFRFFLLTFLGSRVGLSHYLLL